MFRVRNIKESIKNSELHAAIEKAVSEENIDNKKCIQFINDAKPPELISDKYQHGDTAYQNSTELTVLGLKQQRYGGGSSGGNGNGGGDDDGDDARDNYEYDSENGSVSIDELEQHTDAKEKRKSLKDCYFDRIFQKTPFIYGFNGGMPSCSLFDYNQFGLDKTKKYLSYGRELGFVKLCVKKL
jgi:hypothetical protein